MNFLRRVLSNFPRLHRALGAVWTGLRLAALLAAKTVCRVIDRRADDRKLMINIGGGIFFRRHWRVLDFPSPNYNYPNAFIDYKFDLTSGRPLPFEDDAVTCFYSAHTLEHIPQEHCQRILDEVHRCLKPGGAARISLPDFELAHQAYGRADEAFFREYPGDNLEERFLDFFASHLKGKIDPAQFRADYAALSLEELGDSYSDRVPRESQWEAGGNHINWWTKDKLSRMLRKAGFSEVRPSQPQASRMVEMRGPGRRTGFDATHPELSLFIEAIK